MKKVLMFSALGFAAMSLLTDCNNNSAKQTDQKVTESAPAFEVKNMDKSVNPGDDFFDYVNGGWIKSHPIPSDKTIYGAFTELYEKNNNDVKTIIDEISKQKDAPKGSVAQKVRDFYNSGMDSAKIETLGLAPIQDFLDKINAIKTVEDVQKTAAFLTTYNFSPFFSISGSPDKKNSSINIAYIEQSGIGLPERDYYFNKDQSTEKIREAYVKYIGDMFELTGVKHETALKNAQTVMKIETQFAKASNTNVENQDPQKTYNKLTIEQLEKQAPNYDWKNFFSQIGYPDIKEVNISQPNFIKELSTMMKSFKTEDWKIFLQWHVINGMSHFLPAKFANLHFDFFSKTLTGQEKQEPRWKRVLGVLNYTLGEAIGQLYVEKYFPAESKQKMIELVGNLKKSLKNRITKLEWMGDATKKEALEKLEKINVKIGYPDKWRDYSGLEIIPDAYCKNMISASNFEFKFVMNKVGKPVDKSEWEMTPQTVNAYYSPEKNEIVFPAAILQVPFFNINADEAVNYGGIGMVIGHEMTHGFDAQGRQSDKDGNLRDWWTKEDSKKFEDHTQNLINEFNHFEVLDSVHINGKLTLCENIADLGGLTVAYDAYKIAMEGKPKAEPIDGFTPEQRIFLSCAQIWRTNIREKEMRRRIMVDEHSPAKYRINGTLFNMPEFYAAFPEIKPENKLYLAPEKRTVIW
jgi:putative endopeptidase